MTQLFYMFAEMITPIVLMPIIIAIYGKIRRYGNVKTVTCILFSLYLASVFHLTGQPDLLYHRFDPNIYLIPFGEIISDYRNSILNVLLFIPLGFFLPILGKRYHWISRTMMFGFCMTVLIEMLQMFTLRATDINDVITNVVGTLIGWCFWKTLGRRLRWLSWMETGNDVLFCCVSTWAVMFFIQPFTYYTLWKLIIE